MLIHVYSTTERIAPSVLLARRTAEVEVDIYPDEPDIFADEYGGDFLDIAPGEEE